MVILSNCQPGYYYHTGLRQCECIKRKLYGNSVLSCDSTDDADVDPAYWIGLNSSNSNVTLVSSYRKYYHNSIHFQRIL